MKKDASRLVGHCLECTHRISLTSAQVAQVLTCLHRDSQLAVVGVAPLDLTWVCDWAWEGEDEEQEVEF